MLRDYCDWLEEGRSIAERMRTLGYRATTATAIYRAFPSFFPPTYELPDALHLEPLP
jgi:hypothetical protein